jgi:hypothetical protein
VAAFPEASAIFDVNIEAMQRLGHDGWRRLMEDAGSDLGPPPTQH